ncbi:MAG: THUMP domain-containing class I SAM-dependent RNA methyltransferase [Spirochaetota bacterium]
MQHQPEKSLQRRVRRHVKAARHTFFAIVQPGFEETALDELQNLKVNDIVHTHQGGITFRGKVEDCYRVNLCSRIITRVLLRIDRFKAFHFNQVYKRMKSIPWELYLPANAVPEFKVSSSHSKLFHTGRVEEEAATAVIERLSEVRGIARGVKPALNHTQSVYIRLEKNTCTISLDTTGDPLYKRGYKKYITGAPLRETTAAALLMEGGLAEAEVLVDPMCGSGTFSMEGAMMLCGRLPGEKREFPFFYWPVFSSAAYNYLLRDSKKSSGKIATRIICSDIDQESVDVARKNILLAEMDEMISTSTRDFLSEPMVDLPGHKVLCVLNPPYGKRLLEDSVIERLYEKIGVAFREWYPDWGFVLLFPDEKYLKAAGLDFQKMIHFSHGGLKVTAVVRS